MAKSVGVNDDEALPIYRRRRFTGVSVQRSRSWVVTEEDDELTIPVKDAESDSHGCEVQEDDELEAVAEAFREDFGNEDSCGRGEAEGHNQQMTSSRLSWTATSTVFNPTNEAVLQAVLTKRDVLDCPICLDTLFTPVFQCENGHIACSSCCSKLESGCPFCSMPIGISSNIRCRGLEKFIESISSISCKYVWNGCRKTIPYSKKSDHEQMCPYATCECPHPSCHFAGPSKKLYLHFGIKHAASTTYFTYNTTFPLSIDINQKRMFLQEQHENVIFILNQVYEHQKRTFTVDIVGGLGTLLKSSFEYQLTAKSMDTSLSLQSVPERYTEWSNDRPRKSYLTLPSGFVDYSNGLVSLSVCIKKVISSEFVTEAEADIEEAGDDDDDDGNLNEALQVVLTDPGILNCSICLAPLSTPVFQCATGAHIVCSFCCSKMERRCVCFPICNGYNYSRSRGLEEVVASIKKSCKNAR